MSLCISPAAMASLPRLSLLALLLPLLILTSHLADAAADSVFILASKAVKVKRLRDSAEDVLVSLSVYNTGGSIAYDVALNDDSWPSDLFDVAGNSTVSWDKLEGGASAVHSYVVKPKSQSFFKPPPAVLTFRSASKPDLQKAFSTPLSEIGFLQPQPQGAKWAWLKEIVQQFGPLVSAVGVVLLVLYVVFVPISSKKSSKKRR